ncbi:MAG: GntR family transcriptional regulator [Rhodospirillales bacterium]|nr:GntR family transcriptional regulator [Rhodospirillales bacterium]
MQACKIERRHEHIDRSIYDHIQRAILERRISPGARLVEGQLADAFGVSRMRIRDVLHSLAGNKLVTLRRNHGAFVSKPDVKQAKEVLAARRLLETALAQEVVRSIHENGLKELRAHVRRETLLAETPNKADALLVSFNFHTLLATVTGNEVLVAFMNDLMVRFALIAAVFEYPHVTVCSHLAHERLVDFIEQRDGNGLANAMLSHLNDIEQALALYEKKRATFDITEIFPQIRARNDQS